MSIMFSQLKNHYISVTPGIYATTVVAKCIDIFTIKEN